MTIEDSSRTIAEVLGDVLGKHVSPITARSIIQALCKRMDVLSDEPFNTLDDARVREYIESGIGMYLPDVRSRNECIAGLARVLDATGAASTRAPVAPTVVEVKDETDIVIARNMARETATRMGFSYIEQVRIATAVSELARNIVSYARRGTLTFSPAPNGKSGVTIEAVDDGPGIENVEEVLSGSYESRSGMGLGLLGCKRLMDEFSIATSPEEGTRVRMVRYR